MHLHEKDEILELESESSMRIYQVRDMCNCMKCKCNCMNYITMYLYELCYIEIKNIDKCISWFLG